MSVAALGVGGTLALAGTAAGVAGSIMSADAQRSAANKNRDAQQYAADKNYQQFLESRGSGGSAVLPLYLKTGSGQLFEDVLGKNTIADYNAARSSRTESTQGLEQRLSLGEPMRRGAMQTGNDIFTGGIEKQMMKNFQPVAAARVRFKRGAAIDALSKTLNEINAMQSGRGYSGDSLGSQMLRFNARKSAGDEVAGANVQNAQDEQAIKQAALQLRLNNLQLPYTMAQQEMALASMPEDKFIEQMLKEQSMFNWFRLPGANPPQVQPLTYSATPSAGQLAMQGVAQGSGTYLNYLMQQQQQQQYLDAMNQMRLSQPAVWSGSTLPGATYDNGFLMPPMG